MHTRCSLGVSNRPATYQLWIENTGEMHIQAHSPFPGVASVTTRAPALRMKSFLFRSELAHDFQQLTSFCKGIFWEFRTLSWDRCATNCPAFLALPACCRLERSKERTEWPEPIDHPEMVVVYGIGLKKHQNLQVGVGQSTISPFKSCGFHVFFLVWWGLSNPQGVCSAL